MKKTYSRALSFLLVVCLLMGLMAVPAFAATVADATIDTSKTGSIALYKYDYTNAKKDGVWDTDDYISNGQFTGGRKDPATILGGTIREDGIDKGEDETASSANTLGNGETSNGYAIKGVEFTYLKVADIITYSANESGVANVMVLFGFAKDDALLTILGLDADDSYTLANTADTLYFESYVLNNALRSIMAADPSVKKNAIEEYIVENGGTAMALTDEKGYTKVSNLPLGLYLLVETKVPEMVTETTNPFFVSVPMTTVDGGYAASPDTNGGTAWNYDVVIYPKNETGIVELEKTVRESLADGGKHTGSLTDITDGYAHTATASAGDVVDYQIISTLPTITSAATNISVYTFKDILSAGQTYTKGDVKLEWFSDKACTNLVATWTEQDDKFDVAYAAGANDSEEMTITMTAAGLAEINTAAGSFANVNNPADKSLYAGYSNYTVRVTYTATLNEDTSLVLGDAGNDNEVELTWSRTSSAYYDTLNDDCHVYSYGVDLTKEFAEKTADEALAADLFKDVQFKLQNATDGYYVVAALNADEGVYYVTGHDAAEANGTAFTPVTDAEGNHGKIIIKGLEDDAYILTEIQTANGYSLLKDNIDIVISVAETTDSCDVYSKDTAGVTQNDPHYSYEGLEDIPLTNITQRALEHKLLTASATVDGNAVTMLNDTYTLDNADAESGNAIAPLKVVNHVGFDIPETGDNTMILLTSLGTLMVVCAAALLFVIVKNNKKKEQ